MSKPAVTLITNRYAAEAEEWLIYKDEFEDIKAGLTSAREQLLYALSEDEETDVPFLVIRTELGEEVAITEKDKRKFDADKLAKLVSTCVLVKVSKLVVDPEAFDRAVSEGLIDAKVVAKVTTTTPYVDVRCH